MIGAVGDQAKREPNRSRRHATIDALPHALLESLRHRRAIVALSRGPLSSEDVARVFDRMADSYHRLEPWYEHLYAVLHAILRAEIPAGTRRERALDAGCGTGFQTALLEELGYETHGIDISAGLLAIAARALSRASLVRASLETLPYPDASFDVAVSCGSTLSFVSSPAQALAEIGRVLRPRGILLFECEHKWSLDLLWTLASSVTRDSLGYGVSPRAAWRQIARPLSEGFVIDYEQAPLRLFTLTELRAMLSAAGLEPARQWGIHWATNLIPSTVLHRDRLGRMGALLFRRLASVDRRFAGSALARRSANSLVLVARRSACSPAAGLLGKLLRLGPENRPEVDS